MSKEFEKLLDMKSEIHVLVGKCPILEIGTGMPQRAKALAENWIVALG